MMRRRFASMAAVALGLTALTGCGDEESDAGPESVRNGAPPEEFQPEAPDPSLAGTTAVVDLRGKPAEEPERLDFAKEASMEGLTWSGWGGPTATGKGTLRFLPCEPTCADSKVKQVPAKVVLSGPVECDGQRYYSASEVIPREELEAGAPASFLEAPCPGP